MYASGYRFFVLPSEFVVDIPHSDTGPKQTDDNQKLSNVLWRDFYTSVIRKYGLRSLPPYKGKHVCVYTCLRITHRLYARLQGMSTERCATSWMPRSRRLRVWQG